MSFPAVVVYPASPFLERREACSDRTAQQAHACDIWDQFIKLGLGAKHLTGCTRQITLLKLPELVLTCCK